MSLNQKLIHSSVVKEASAHMTEQLNNLRMMADSLTSEKEKRPGSPLSNQRNIRSKAADPTEVTIKDENLPYLRELRRLRINRCKADKQIKYLQNCCNRGNYPRQLVPKLAPQTPTKPIYLLVNWQKSLVQLASNLTQCLMDYWTKHYNSVEKEIKDLLQLIKDNIEPDEYNLIFRICDEAEEKFKSTLVKNVKKKQEIQQNNAQQQTIGGQPVPTQIDQGRIQNTQ